MDYDQFKIALEQLAEERGLSKKVIFDAINVAIAAAYRRDYGHPEQVIRAEFDPKTGEARVWEVYTVVEEVENRHAEKTLEEAKEIKADSELGDELEVAQKPESEFGRIAAQTAKQVIIQRLREAENSLVYEEFKSKVGVIVNGTVQQIDRGNVFVSVGRTAGIMPSSGQIRGEHYYIGQRLRVLVKEVQESTRGPQIILNRSDPAFIEELFKNEVPEIETGQVEIVRSTREAGARTKIAVKTNDDSLDPVGSLVGQRGTRVQAVLAEIGNEKIDIVAYDEDPKQFIQNALSPARIEEIELDEKSLRAMVRVPEDQLSLAIGKAGQNVRLASKISGYMIDINKELEGRKTEARADDLMKLGLTKATIKKMEQAGFKTVGDVAVKSAEDLTAIPGIGIKMAGKILGAVNLFMSQKSEGIESRVEADHQGSDQKP